MLRKYFNVSSTEKIQRKTNFKLHYIQYQGRVSKIGQPLQKIVAFDLTIRVKKVSNAEFEAELQGSPDQRAYARFCQYTQDLHLERSRGLPERIEVPEQDRRVYSELACVEIPRIGRDHKISVLRTLGDALREDRASGINKGSHQSLKISLSAGAR